MILINIFSLECCKDKEWCEGISEPCTNADLQNYCPQKCKNELPRNNPCIAY